jgi:hypothetical protein
MSIAEFFGRKAPSDPIKEDYRAILQNLSSIPAKSAQADLLSDFTTAIQSHGHIVDDAFVFQQAQHAVNEFKKHIEDGAINRWQGKYTLLKSKSRSELLPYELALLKEFPNIEVFIRKIYSILDEYTTLQRIKQLRISKDWVEELVGELVIVFRDLNYRVKQTLKCLD